MYVNCASARIQVKELLFEMVQSRKSNDGLLARVNFPLYSVEMLTSRHVLVAGGGGSAKTGVANGFVSHPKTTFCYFLYVELLCLSATIDVLINY